MNLRIIARAIIYNNKKILLVKNKGEDFWYPPGGEWEHKKENIKEAATREAKEETGLDVSISQLLYLQEFHPEKELIFFETFWLAKPLANQDLNKKTIDQDPTGQVEIAKWFSKQELQNLKVFPKRLKNNFWEKIKTIEKEEDPFIGIS